MLKSIVHRTKSAVGDGIFWCLRQRGYEVRRQQQGLIDNWLQVEREARQRYAQFDENVKRELPATLQAKYRMRTVLGKVRVYDAIAELASIINPLDPRMGCVSQLTHSLQVASAMEQDGFDENFVLCALIHDIGTLLFETDEDPINVESSGQKVPIEGEISGGLENCTFRWDHGDFAYLRFKDYVPDEVAWVLRHHGMDALGCELYMNEKDRTYTEKYFRPFAKYNNLRDLHYLPQKRLEDYRGLLDRVFPDPILI